MKIKKLIFSKTNFMAAGLLPFKSQFDYNANEKYQVNHFKNLEFNLKKFFKFIFEFHRYDSTIVFVGFPCATKYDFRRLFKKFKYISLNKNIWINGTLCNSKSLLPYVNSKKIATMLKKKNIVFLNQFGSLIKLEKNPDLVVLFDNSSNKNIIKECQKLKIPVISFIGKTMNKSLVISNVFNLERTHYSKRYLSKYIYLLLSSVLHRYLKKSVN